MKTTLYGSASLEGMKILQNNTFMVCPGEKIHDCKRQLLAIQDTLDIIGGKWKVTILGCLAMGEKRFMDLQRELVGIGPKMLSRELHELEVNGLIQKNENAKYKMTAYSDSLKPVIQVLAEWGMQHRVKVMSMQ
ncbi:helix-turn-helix domain-containing protein [Chitinophaga sp.]|uniref:winged helix-turn-helix transcriptional regulator n=1 Tax=Chitinophaga sp. TaxID=1869181 RepID=UPI0031D553A8